MMKAKESIDPEFNRWNRTYPKFPSVHECVELLKRRNVQGTWVDIICFGLTDYASDNLDEMITVFHEETADWPRLMLLWAIVDARLPQVFPFLVETLHSDNPRHRELALQGLRALNTRQSRTFLWDMRNEISAIDS